MKIIDTSVTDPESLSGWEREQIYNGLDICITSEVLSVLEPQLDNHTAATYAFSRELQGPVMEMRLRGVLVDQQRKGEVIDEYLEKLDTFETSLEAIVRGACGIFGFNWRSPQQLQDLFYGSLRIPPIRWRGRPTVNRAALERIECYPIAWAIVQHITAMRDLAKKISVLKTAIDSDGRMRTSYNIGGTATFRFSSSFSEFGTGTNFQNIEEALRTIFIADPGMKFGYFDGEQIQSRIVGAIEWNLFHDGKYLDACETGDLHTTVAKLCEPKKVPWTGNLEEDKEIAEKFLYYRHYSIRKLCKCIGHGTNFMGGPKTLNHQYKVEAEAIEKFQKKYLPAFPGHEMWWEWTRNQLQEFGYVIALGGQKRYFWGRKDSLDTLREALAYDAQATEAKIVNSGMLKTWRENHCQLMMQLHDAILVQYPEEKEDEIVKLVKTSLKYPIKLDHGRELLIPFGCKTGWNFSNFSEDNVDGLKEYQSGDKRKRTPAVGIMDRRVR